MQSAVRELSKIITLNLEASHHFNMTLITTQRMRKTDHVKILVLIHFDLDMLNVFKRILERLIKDLVLILTFNQDRSFDTADAQTYQLS